MSLYIKIVTKWKIYSLFEPYNKSNRKNVKLSLRVYSAEVISNMEIIYLYIEDLLSLLV